MYFEQFSSTLGHWIMFYGVLYILWSAQSHRCNIMWLKSGRAVLFTLGTAWVTSITLLFRWCNIRDCAERVQKTTAVTASCTDKLFRWYWISWCVKFFVHCCGPKMALTCSSVLVKYLLFIFNLLFVVSTRINLSCEHFSLFTLVLTPKK